MRFKDLRIGVRMGVGLAALMCVMVAMFAVTLVETERSRALHQSATDDMLQRKALIDEAKEGLLEAAVAMRNIGLLMDVDAAQREEIVVKAKRMKLEAALRSLADRTSEPEASRLLLELKQLETKMAAPISEAVALALAFSPEGAVKVITAKIDPLYQQSLTRMGALVALESRRAEAITVASAAAAATLRFVLLAGCSLALTLSAAIGWWLTRSVTVPIRKAVRVAHDVARGDLSGRIESDSNDETGELLASLRTMSDTLKTMLNQVLLSADSIAIATREVAAGAADLSARTEEAASQTQATVGVIDALGETVQANAGHALEASQMADTATGVARHGGEVVTAVVSTMARITDSSKKISDIISVIDGIAFQTNILALNAAVEAARAGEQGRGFAVVASEVRALAQRSAGAAREIKTLITASVQSVVNGAALVDKAGGAMSEIVSSIHGFHEVIRRVSSASDEQASGVERVKSAIIRIDDATQRNAALVEQSAAASGSLQQQADNLRRAIGTFKV